VRSVVNLGTKIADLVLLLIEEMNKKDGHLSGGIQKGTSLFAKNTTLEVINLRARLAIGTQVMLEKAESILGAKFHQELCGETIERLPSPDPNLAPLHHHPTGLPLPSSSTRAPSVDTRSNLKASSLAPSRLFMYYVTTFTQPLRPS